MATPIYTIYSVSKLDGSTISIHAIEASGFYLQEQGEADNNYVVDEALTLGDSFGTYGDAIFMGWTGEGLIIRNQGEVFYLSQDDKIPYGSELEFSASDYDLLNPPTVPCYLAGTSIQTERGAVAVEDLVAGDRLQLLSGDFAPLRWIGQRHVSARLQAQDPQKALPIRFAAGALGDCLPKQTLFVSPDHCLYHDGALIPARRLVNGTSVTQAHPGGAITYYHLLLDGHQVIFAEGVAAESFLPSGNIFGFQNGASFPKDVTATQSCFPLRFSGGVVAALQARIAACAETCDQGSARAA